MQPPFKLLKPPTIKPFKLLKPPPVDEELAEVANQFSLVDIPGFRPRATPWRDEVAALPVAWREDWGHKAAGLEAGGLAWDEAEAKAAEDVREEMKTRRYPVYRPKATPPQKPTSTVTQPDSKNVRPLWVLMENGKVVQPKLKRGESGLPAGAAWWCHEGDTNWTEVGTGRISTHDIRLRRTQ